MIELHAGMWYQEARMANTVCVCVCVGGGWGWGGGIVQLSSAQPPSCPLHVHTVASTTSKQVYTYNSNTSLACTHTHTHITQPEEGDLALLAYVTEVAGTGPLTFPEDVAAGMNGKRQRSDVFHVLVLLQASRRLVPGQQPFRLVTFR